MNTYNKTILFFLALLVIYIYLVSNRKLEKLAGCQKHTDSKKKKCKKCKGGYTLKKGKCKKKPKPPPDDDDGDEPQYSQQSAPAQQQQSAPAQQQQSAPAQQQQSAPVASSITFKNNTTSLELKYKIVSNGQTLAETNPLPRNGGSQTVSINGAIPAKVNIIQMPQADAWGPACKCQVYTATGLVNGDTIVMADGQYLSIQNKSGMGQAGYHDALACPTDMNVCQNEPLK